MPPDAGGELSVPYWSGSDNFETPVIIVDFGNGEITPGYASHRSCDPVGRREVARSWYVRDPNDTEPAPPCWQCD
ncbi:MAG: hypothetical protein ISS62_01500 [Desulfobacteraceae bacterium]|nr:hypothetical protein [Desulfobacteraceae bacterium]